MTNLRVFNNPYAFVDEGGDDAAPLDLARSAEVHRRCTDLLTTLENTRAYFESLQGLSPEELASLRQDYLESEKVRNAIACYAADLIYQMSCLRDVLSC